MYVCISQLGPRRRGIRVPTVAIVRCRGGDLYLWAGVAPVH